MIDDGFKIWIENLLKDNKQIANQLVFSITAYGCTRDIEAFKQFIELIHNNNGKVILKRFETKFMPLDSLKEFFNLDYIRLARDYTCDIDSNKQKQKFVESICELSKLLNIEVFAENIDNDECFTILQGLGLYGASK